MKVDGGGQRKDEGKPAAHLLPPDALLAIGKVFLAGAKKYDERNWERGMPWSKCYGPLIRHALKYWMGHDRDPESGQLHIVHVAVNALMLAAYALRGIGKDDRNNLIRGKDEKASN